MEIVKVNNWMKGHSASLATMQMKFKILMGQKFTCIMLLNTGPWSYFFTFYYFYFGIIDVQLHAQHYGN